uniref:Rho-GAP domain-containing protein n=1 Tax=Ciona savignyi TaxID=51511 RepID=H2ZDC1_CIOSA
MAGLICNDKCSRYFAYHILEEELNIRLSISLNNLQKDVDCCETSQGTHSNDSLGFGKSLSEIKLCKLSVCDTKELLLHPPYILHQLSQHLLQHLDTEGLFRKRGLTRRINILKDKLEQGVELSDENPHDVANLFTLFLRQLPQHLFPASFNPILLQVLHSMQEANQIKMVQCLCWLLPRHHFETLLYVVHFFQSVAQHSNNNRMSLDGLATILAPNIVQFEMTAKNYRIITETQTHFVHLLLLHALDFVQLPTMSTEV